ncbi:MAG: DUF2804 domain-containing protein [Desulfobacter sp.]|nr:DUF2804 domain-containing protein [Desulfobacter sp.]
MSLVHPWSGPFNRQDTSGLVGLPLPQKFKNAFKEKRWCYAGIVSDDIFFGAAVVHLGYAASGFCFGFDRKTKKMVEYTKVGLPTNQVRYDRNPESGTCWFKRGQNLIEISGCRPQRKLKVNLKEKNLTADIDIFPPDSGFAPMHFPMDMGRGKNAFTTKAAGLSAKGHIKMGDKHYFLSPETGFAIFDWTHGAYPRQTFWNWACGAGQARDKTDTNETQAIGFNFSKGVYENGRLENTLWINGKPEPVSAVDFSYDPKNPTAPWEIVSTEPKIKLRFTPEGMRQANDNFIVLASRFIQPCGRFKGEITLKSGQTLVLKNTGGVVEEHYAKW